MEVTYKGKVYNSVKELCDAYDIKASMFGYYNRTKGMSVEDSVERCLQSKPRGITYNGVTYATELEMCNRLGVDYSNYLKRKSIGKSFEECLFPYKMQRGGKGKEVCYQGKVYHSIKELCNTYDVDVCMFRYYNITKGMSVENSIERCLQSKPRGITYNGVTYATELEMCNRLGVKYTTYMKRKSRGRTLEECLLDEDRRGGEGKEVYYQGKVYESERAFCEAHGVSYGAYRARRKRGYTIEESLKPVKRGTSKGTGR